MESAISRPIIATAVVAAMVTAALVSGLPYLHSQYEAYAERSALTAYRNDCDSTRTKLTAYIKEKSAYDDAAVDMATSVNLCVEALRDSGYPFAVPYRFIEYPDVGSGRFAAVN